MVKQIRIYIEGDPQLHEGFRVFLQPLYDAAKSNRIKIEPPKLCGSRGDAYKAFKAALKTHPDALIVLLVDSEGPVDETPWAHLASRPEDNWNSLGTDDTSCHLMVQAMEAWFIADTNALHQFYGTGFQESALPKNPCVEDIGKSMLTSSLEMATRNTRKGKYHKTRHASHLLTRLDVDRVRKAAPHCDRLFSTLTRLMETE
jgi:hypothetical protein